MINKELQNMILEGKHQTQDFEYAISDSIKIAQTFSAFANTDGGRILLGVMKDGTIAGIQSEEEIKLAETAAKIHCNPKLPFKTRQLESEEKTVVEITIPKSTRKPHSAPDSDGDQRFYIREKHQNLLANHILIEVWKKERQGGSGLLKIRYNENKLLNYLNLHHQITFSKFCGMANISPRKAEKILINLVYMKVIKMVFTESQVFYIMNPVPDRPTPNDPDQTFDF
ncbi:MAG: ATP-binding protein [Marinilabiliaceae bacterium]|nr:ATP-binding protein [Marinilabiliaceae bacterium]